MKWHGKHSLYTVTLLINSLSKYFGGIFPSIISQSHSGLVITIEHDLNFNGFDLWESGAECNLGPTWEQNRCAQRKKFFVPGSA